MRRAVVILAFVALTGCAREAAGTRDSPINHPTNNAPADIINMPNGYANIATKCDGHGHRLYVTTRDAPPIAISDPTCPGATQSN